MDYLEVHHCAKLYARACYRLEQPILPEPTRVQVEVPWTHKGSMNNMFIARMKQVGLGWRKTEHSYVLDMQNLDLRYAYKFVDYLAKHRIKAYVTYS